MYCGNCGNLLKENGHFCGKCGRPVYIEPKVVYKEENKLPSLLEDRAVVALTFCVLILSIVTIVCASIFTKDIPSEGALKEKITTNIRIS